jgi:hypothetical protein
MQHFEFILKNEKLRSYNKITLFLQLIYTVIFLFYLWKEYHIISLAISITLAVLLTGSLVIKFLSKPVLKQKYFIQSIWGEAIAAIAFLVIFKNYWFGFGIILIGIFEFWSTKKLKVFFFAEKIQLDFSIKKNIDWQQLNNVILKDRLLTIDFKNDRLIQTEIAEESYAIDEATFNQFCRQQLQTVNSKL